MKHKMKKIIVTIVLIAGISVSAQVKIGTSATTIHAGAMLELEAVNKGLKFPPTALTSTTAWLPLAGSAVMGMTVYNTETTGDVTPGLYTNNGTVWVKNEGVASVSSSTIYTADGTLTGARTITQNNNDLTFATGNGKTIVNGTFKTTGAVHANVRTVTTLPIVWADNDYMIIVKVSSAQNLILPDPTLNSGRVIYIRNGSLNAGTAGSYTYVTYVPQDVSSISVSRGQTLVSDGSKWFVISGI